MTILGVWLVVVNFKAMLLSYDAQEFMRQFVLGTPCALGWAFLINFANFRKKNLLLFIFYVLVCVYTGLIETIIAMKHMLSRPMDREGYWYHVELHDLAIHILCSRSHIFSMIMNITSKWIFILYRMSKKFWKICRMSNC